MAARVDGKDAHELHACLLCDLSRMLVEDDLKNLKQVLKSAGKIPTDKIKKVTNFYELWNVLEQNGCVSEGKYDVLIEYLERMQINICVIKIKEYIGKIEEYRARKHQRSLKESTPDGLSESRTRQMVNDMVASAMQQFDERSHKIEDRIDNALKKEDDGSTGKLEDRISAQIAKVVKAEVEDKVNIVMKTAEDRFCTQLEDRMKTQTEDRIKTVEDRICTKLEGRMKTQTEDRIKTVEDRICTKLEGRMKTQTEDRIKTVEDRICTKLEGRMKTQTGITEDKVNVMMKTTADGLSAMIADIVNTELSKNLSTKAQPSTPVVVKAAATAEVNRKDENGKTLLICAAIEGNIVNVNSLLQSGADPDLKNQAASGNLVKEFDYVTKEKTGRDIGQKGDGKTALSWAKDCRHGNIVKMLNVAGAK